jgi:hypothetical protein
MSLPRTIAALFNRLPPVRWFRAAEDGLFRLAAEAEYRLKITPRGTKIVPNTFDRRMVRLFLVVMPMLVVSLFWGNRAQRLQGLFIILVLAAVALAWIFVADAFPGKKGPGPRSGRPLPKAPPSKAPPSKRSL